MADYLYDKNGFCRAKTRGQQQLCKLGNLDKFDDFCQWLKHDMKCSFAGKRVSKKGEIVDA